VDDDDVEETEDVEMKGPVSLGIEWVWGWGSLRDEEDGGR